MLKKITREAVIKEVKELSFQTAVCFVDTSDFRLEKLATNVIQRGELLELAIDVGCPKTWEKLKMAFFNAYFELYYYVKHKS